MLTTAFSRNVSNLALPMQRHGSNYIKFCKRGNLCDELVRETAAASFKQKKCFFNGPSLIGRRYYCSRGEQKHSTKSGKSISGLALYAGIGLASAFALHNLRKRSLFTKGYDENDTISMTNFLGDSRISANKRRALATNIFEKPGSFNPRTLLDAAMFFMIEKDFEKSMVLLVGSINRCKMDLLFIDDRSLNGAPTILQNHMFELVDQLGLSQDERSQLQHESDKAIKNFDVWNSQHPFDYSETWLSSSGDRIKGEERDRIRQEWVKNTQ